MLIKKEKAILKNQFGMSMLETLVGTAFVGMIILFGMKQSEIMGKSKFDAKIDRDIIEWHGEITQLLAKAETCQANFEGRSIDFDYTGLVDENGIFVYREHAGNDDNLLLKYQVKINRIYTQVENNQIVLNIDIEKVKTNARTRLLTKKVHIMADLNAGIIENCFSFEDSVSSTIQYLMASGLCEVYGEPGSPEHNAHFDPVNKTCNFSGFFADTNCPDGEVITSITLNAQGEHVPSCSAPYTPSTCPESWVQSVDAQGNFSCVDFSALVNTTQITNFTTGQQCNLSIVSNQIQLVCN